MKQSETLTKIAPALVAALSEMRGALKDSKNPHFRNDYASLESVIETAKPVLAAHGLAFMQGLGEYVGGAMTVSTRIIHESGEWIESDFQMPVGKADPQGTASASTYARRYSLMGILGLPALDDDGEAAMTRSAPPKPEAKNPTVSVQPEGLDWYGASGTGMSAYAAKQKKLELVHDQWRQEIASIPTMEALQVWARNHDEEIKALPWAWRVEIREEWDARKAEL